jgi:histidyl-tRNA synthetase
MKTIRCVKGMHDILPDEMPLWHFIEDSYRWHVGQFGYRELRTPILEPLELFVRGIGETTDIVEKEMYAFEDKGGARLALRPEGTASAIRAFNQHNIQASGPVTKWYYIGPMFRRERPAKGRYRQFYQAGAELIGPRGPVADAELIGMVVRFIEKLGIGDTTVQLNTLGDLESRAAFRAALVEFFTRRKKELCGDCQRRLSTNPLRILDCKNAACREVASGAASIREFLSPDAAADFEELRRLLDRAGVRFTVVDTMVRGLDYYTSTIFEVQVESEVLGAQAAIVGGGRYDGLVKELGGKGAPAIGFSFGIERLILLLAKERGIAERPVVFVAGVGEGGLDRSVDLSWRLRDRGFRVECGYSQASLKSQLKRANKASAAVVVIAGEEEAQRGMVTLRDMSTGEQREVKQKLVEQELEAIL